MYSSLSTCCSSPRCRENDRATAMCDGFGSRFDSAPGPRDSRIAPRKKRAVNRVGVSRRKNFFERCPCFVPARGRRNALLTYCLSNRAPFPPGSRTGSRLVSSRLVSSRRGYFQNVIHSDSPFLRSLLDPRKSLIPTFI